MQDSWCILFQNNFFRAYFTPLALYLPIYIRFLHKANIRYWSYSRIKIYKTLANTLKSIIPVKPCMAVGRLAFMLRLLIRLKLCIKLCLNFCLLFCLPLLLLHQILLHLLLWILLWILPGLLLFYCILKLYRNIAMKDIVMWNYDFTFFRSFGLGFSNSLIRKLKSAKIISICNFNTTSLYSRSVLEWGTSCPILSS